MSETDDIWKSYNPSLLLLGFSWLPPTPCCSSLSGSIFLPIPQIKVFPRVLNSFPLYSPFVHFPIETNCHQQTEGNIETFWLFSLGPKLKMLAKSPTTWTLLQEGEASQKKKKERKIPMRGNKGQRGIWPSQWGQLSLKWDWQASLCHQTRQQCVLH